MDTREKDTTTSNGETKGGNTFTIPREGKQKLDLGLYVRLEPSPGEITVAKVEKCPFCNCQWYNVNGNNYRFMS